MAEAIGRGERMMRPVPCFAAALFFASTAVAQRYQIGGDFGYGFYRNGTIFSAAGAASAGIRNRFAAGFWIGEDVSQYVSGEIRYLYQDGHPFLTANGTKAEIQGQSHTWTFDLLFHFKDREHRLRPFVAGGVGAKGYIIAGPEPYPQPIPNIASLVANDEWKFAVDVGGGVEWRLAKHVNLRAEFRDYLTRFPRYQILPAPHNTARGIFQQLTPLIGVSYSF